MGAGDAFSAGLLALLYRKGWGREALARLEAEALRPLVEGAVGLSALAYAVQGADLPDLAPWRARYLG